MSDDFAVDNSAWVTLEIPVAPAALMRVLNNIERLFRLNPYLDIKQWEGRAAGIFHFEALNEMNGVVYDLDVTLETQLERRLLLRYSQGLKEALEVSVEATTDPYKSILTLREYYHKAEQALNQEQLKEIDHSLIPWGNTIRTYAQGMQRWHWCWPYRWYREKFWLVMRPTHRRIARMLLWVTVLEFIVFLFIFIIYWLEWLR